MVAGTCKRSSADPQVGVGDRTNWQCCGLFKPQSLLQGVYLLQQGHNSQFFSNSSTSWGTNIQLHELVGTILIEHTTVRLLSVFEVELCKMGLKTFTCLYYEL